MLDKSPKWIQHELNDMWLILVCSFASLDQEHDNWGYGKLVIHHTQLAYSVRDYTGSPVLAANSPGAARERQREDRIGIVDECPFLARLFIRLGTGDGLSLVVSFVFLPALLSKHLSLITFRSHLLSKHAPTLPAEFPFSYKLWPGSPYLWSKHDFNPSSVSLQGRTCIAPEDVSYTLTNR